MQTTERLDAALEGRYRIERELGAGGMATVYLAEDLKHRRKVALKLLKPELAAVVGAERFLAEIATTAALQHPHILPLFDSGEAGGFLYYVMPYVSGETLRAKLDREKQLSVDLAVEIASKVADALDYAHEHGVIHRDVKPGNILLSERGEPLVADFGIALALSAAGGDRITETGLSLGTPHYMSPEQASGDRGVDHRSDLYSLGCVLYEMLTGDPPHTGATLQSVLAKVLSEDPRPVTMIRKTVPANVEAAVMKALARVPADRFATSKELARALADPTFRLAATRRKPGVAAGSRLLTAALAAGLVVMAGIAVGAIATRPDLPVVRIALSLPPEQRPVYGGINLTPPRVALTPDGAAIVYVGPGPTTAAEVLPGGGRAFPGGQFTLGVASQLWIHRLSELKARPIPGTERAWAPSVSPDSRSVAFSVYQGTTTQIRVAPLAGGPPLTVATAGDLASASWGGSDELYFVGPSGRHILRVPASGGTPDTMTTLPASADARTRLDALPPGGRILWLDVLPGGKGAIATIGLQTQGRLTVHEIQAIDFERGTSERVVTGVYGRYVRWGYLLYVTSDNVLMAVPFDPKTRRVTGLSTALIEGVDYRNNGAADLAASPTGSLVYSTPGYNAPEVLMWVDRDGRVSPVDPDWSGPLEFEALALSPDGDRLAVEMVAELQRGDIWIKQLPRGPLSRLTFEGEDNRVPAWSPDGSRISYLSLNKEGAWDLLQRPADGSGGPERLPNPGRELHEVAWSPDGQWLIGSVAGGQGDDVVGLRVGTDTSWTVLVGGPADQFEPAVSLSGRWVAYVSEESGRAEIYVRPFTPTGSGSGKWQISIEGGIEPFWGSSDRTLYYRSFDGSSVWQASLASGPAAAVREVVFRIPEGAYEANPRNRLIFLAPDGQRFLMINQTGEGDVSGDLVFVQNLLAELKRRTTD